MSAAILKSASSFILSHDERTKSSTGVTLAGSAQPTQWTPVIGKARRCALRCSELVIERPSSVSEATESALERSLGLARGRAPPKAAPATTSAPLAASERSSSCSSSSASASSSAGSRPRRAGRGSWASSS